MIRRFALALFAAGVVAVPAGALAQEPPPPPPSRQPLTEVPVGCPIQPLPDVVFVGTVVDSDFRTVRFNIDQPRAGDLSQFATGNLVDVRYGIDTKYLDEGDQYLVGASWNPNIELLRSRVKPEPITFGGDEIIGATEIDRACPEVADPIRTLHTDGTPIESGMLSPFVGDSRGLLRAILIPLGVVCGAIFLLAAIRWMLTGFGRGVESIARTSTQSRETRSAMRARGAAPAVAGRSPPAGRGALPPSRSGRRRR